MRVTSIAPSRISFVGGSTDISPYKEEYGGAVVSLAINIRTHFTFITAEDVASLTKNCDVHGGDSSFVPNILNEFNTRGSWTMSYDTQLRGGLGGSASGAVAVVGAMNKLLNLKMDRMTIAQRAYDIEIKKLFGGIQDEMASAHGGLNLFNFTKDKVLVQPFHKQYVDTLVPNLVLMHTNIIRKDPTLQENFKTLNKAQIQILNKIKSLVLPMVEAIQRCEIVKLGELLNTAWQYKKESNKVTTSQIDKIYADSKNYGALGGKLLGSGGGGHMLFVVSPNKRQKFINNMTEKGLTYVDFSPDFNGLEVKIL